MTKRVIARLYLPLDLSMVTRVSKAIAAVQPDAVLQLEDVGSVYAIVADPDITPAERRRIARERTKA